MSKNIPSACCKTKGIKTEELIDMKEYSLKSKSVLSTMQWSAESQDLLTDSSPLSNRLKKDKKKMLSEDVDHIQNIDHSPTGLMKYYREIEKKCDDNCLTKKYFVEELVQKYSQTRTLNNIDFVSIIFLNIARPEALCPYVIDADSYNVFKDFFKPIICELHNTTAIGDLCQGINYGDIDEFENLDLNEDNEVLKVMYCEVVVRRNLSDFNLAGCLKDEQRLVIKEMMKAKCRELFSSLSSLTIPNEWVSRLRKDEVYLVESRSLNNYPKGRVNMAFKDHLDGTIGVIVNYDDHLQLISSTNNGKIGHVYNQINKIMNSTVMCKTDFQKHQKYGHITYSPRYLGTGLTIMVVLRLHYVCLMDDVEELYLKDIGLSLKSYGEPDKGLVLLSNQRTMGIREIEIFQTILEGCEKLSNLDQELKITSPNAVNDKTMPTESLATLVGKINSCETSKTYAKKYLTDVLVHQYNNVLTSFNGLLNHCIRANAFYPLSLFPKASDPDCYSTFSRYFNPIILEANHCRQFLHNDFPDYGFARSESRYKLRHELIKGYRVRFSRNFEDYPFPMLMTARERKEIESQLISVFKTFPKEISGNYYKLENISENEQFDFLRKLNLLPKNNNDIKRASWVYRDWPQNRGIFLANKNTEEPNNVLIILVNEDDHFQVSCTNFSGVGLDYCYDRAVMAMRYLDVNLSKGYARKPNYGFLSSNPQNTGCCMRIGAKLYLKHLGEDRPVLNRFCMINDMNYRGLNGSGSKTKNNIFDISLKLNLNYSEIQILMIFTQRLKDLILEERKYDESIPKPNNFNPTIKETSVEQSQTVKSFQSSEGTLLSSSESFSVDVSVPLSSRLIKN